MDRHHIIFVFLVVLLTQCSNHMARCVITDVRLVGSPTSNKGTVEIRIDNGTWETTCGVNLGIGDIIVICRQLGFTGANTAIKYTPYGQSSTPTRGLGCIGANYTYAGVELGTDCYCGEADARYSRHGEVPNEFCQNPCSGDPTESCGGIGFISVFTIQVETVETTNAVVSTEKVNEVTTQVSLIASQPSSGTTRNTKDAVTSSTMITPLQTPTTLQHSGNCSYVASTLAVGILLAFVTLYGIIITLMYLHLRRSKIALKPSVSDREVQELDPYTSLDATTVKQPAYEDIKAPRHGNRGHTNAIEGVEYENQTIVKQTARVKKSNSGVANENTEPDYELPVVK
ncbi:uncharacterized protein LOC105438137 [Strongylocentrotus purpuratus]|uniref:WSC domain-containing protein n=1 Tax=Strongylocentrotus purpuratus TaxID=7668 RepID=A0A7M7NP30_STRPU|nr:uncharacterized protein LOC105438137 [Strongylocentrotus purpuratus]